MKNKYFFISFLIIYIFIFLINDTIYASEEDEINYIDMSETYLQEIDCSEVQEVIDSVGNDNEIDFSSKVKEIIEQDGSAKEMIRMIFESVIDQISFKRELLVELILLSVVAALFTNFTRSFSNNSISETSFSVVYLLLFAILISTFSAVTLISSNVMEILLNFMKVLIPVYTAAIVFGTGTSSAIVFYETILTGIAVLDWLYFKIIIPIVNVYVVIVLADNISKESMLTKFAQLIRSIIKWTNRTVLATIAGLQIIQQMVSSTTDEVKKSILVKATGVMPIVGNSFSAVGESVIGAGIVVKNAVGVTGIIVIISICAIPLINILIYILTYSIAAAAVQPISDKRITNCISGVADGAKLLFEVVLSGMILFIFSIAVIAK